MYNILAYDARKIQTFTKNVCIIVHTPPQCHKNNAMEIFRSQYIVYLKRTYHGSKPSLV